MVATRKISTTWACLAGAFLVGLVGGYTFLGQQPVMAQFGESPIAKLQREVRNLLLHNEAQDAELVDLRERVELLEEFAFGGGPPPGGGSLVMFRVESPHKKSGFGKMEAVA